MTGAVPFFHVGDISQSLQEVLDAGGQRMEDPRDVGGGRLVASVKDADGNVIGLLQDPH